jgi:hypothetical protein
VTKAQEFEQLKQRPRSRWSGCIQKLLRSKDGAVETEIIPSEIDTSYEREKARKAIVSLARHYGLRVSITRNEKQFYIKRLCKVEAMQ